MKGSKKKVLIVDDDPLVAGLYKGKLESDGYIVEIAPDGQQALLKVKDFVPDAVLLDLMLPQMSGVEVLRRIRAEAALKNLPVLVFSNAFATVLVNDAMAAGATRVLNKAEASPLQVLVCVREVLFPGIAPASGPSGGAAKRESTGTAALFGKAPRPTAAGASPSASIAAPKPQSPSPVTSPQRPLPSPAPVPSPASAPILPRASQAPLRMPPPAAPVDPVSPPVASPQPKASAVTPRPLTELVESTSDEFESSLRDEFFADGPGTIGFLRKQLALLNKETTDLGRVDVLQVIHRKITGVTGNAGVVRLTAMSQICSLLESFLKELEQKPSNLNASTMRTIAQTVDFLAVLFEKKGGTVLGEEPQPCVLVVDDEAISRRAVVFALNKARVASVDLADPHEALEKATDTKFDLIYLDVDMPEINGFELCSRIRANTQNKTTPVVFITGLTDFESRARSTLSGGNDLIAKPFMFIELAVKSLTYILKGRLAGLGRGTK